MTINKYQVCHSIKFSCQNDLGAQDLCALLMTQDNHNLNLNSSAAVLKQLLKIISVCQKTDFNNQKLLTRLSVLLLLSIKSGKQLQPGNTRKHWQV